MGDIGIPPVVRHVHDFVLAILHTRIAAQIHPKLHVGDHWIARFQDRHPEGVYLYSVRSENEHAAAGETVAVNSSIGLQRFGGDIIFYQKTHTTWMRTDLRLDKAPSSQRVWYIGEENPLVLGNVTIGNGYQS